MAARESHGKHCMPSSANRACCNAVLGARFATSERVSYYFSGRIVKRRKDTVRNGTSTDSVQWVRSGRKEDVGFDQNRRALRPFRGQSRTVLVEDCAIAGRFCR